MRTKNVGEVGGYSYSMGREEKCAIRVGPFFKVEKRRPTLVKRTVKDCIPCPEKRSLRRSVWE